MIDTSFTVPRSKRHRLVDIYEFSDETDGTDGTKFVQVAGVKANASKDALYPELPEDACLVGTYAQPSGGLVSSLDDYFSFSQMLLDGGVASKTGQRVLGRRTVELFASNRLPACSLNGEVDCGELGRERDLPKPGRSNTNQGYSHVFFTVRSQ
jgi:CubicO group peptidase (beta-lactamase class C family)